MPETVEYEYGARFDAGQDDRFPAALADDYVKIDERSEQDLMASLVELSQYINYYDETNAPRGTWLPFLLKDNRWTYAWILSSDYQSKSVRFRYLALAAKGREGAALGDSINAALEVITEIFVDVDTWSKNRRSTFAVAETRFDRYVEACMGGDLKTGLTELLEVLASLKIPNFDLSRKADDRVERCSKAWGLKAESGSPVKPAEAIARLSRVFDDAYRIYVSIIELARSEYLNFDYKGEAPPDIAMLTAFLRLFRRQQEQINANVRRHLNFQYRDILGFSENARIADACYVTFALSESLKRGLLEDGTRLDGGKGPDGRPAIFRLEGELALNQSRLDSAFTIFQDTSAKSEGGLFFGRCGEVGKLDSSADQPELAWPLFGSTEIVELPRWSNRTGSLAWMVSAPDLQLKQGRRKLRIVFVAADEFPSEKTRFGFRYFFSGPEGWFESEPEESIEGNRITLDFRFGLDAPPIVSGKALAADMAKRKLPPAKWPVLRMELDPDGSQYPELCDMRLLRMEIETEVSEAAEIQLRHDASKADVQAPCPLFAGLPSAGSSLTIFEDEALAKPLNRLSIEIEWDNLPPEGISGHYSVYNDYFFKNGEPYNLHGDAFKARFDRWTGQDWESLDGGAPHKLFKAIDPDFVGESEITEPTTSFDFELAGVAVKRLRLTFAEPNIGFGHSQFGHVVNFANIQSSKFLLEFAFKKPAWLRWPIKVWKWIFRIKTKIPEPPRAPNAPMNPVVKEIWLGYTSKRSYDFEAESKGQVAIYHQTPFSNYVSYDSGDLASPQRFIDGLPPEEKGRGLPILPSFTAQGSLYLNIRDHRPLDTVTFYFELWPDETRNAALGRADLSCQYFSAIGWKAFGHNVLEDTTNGLVRTGLLRVVLPSDIGDGGIGLPGGGLWIALRSRSGNGNFTRARLVRLNTGLARRVIEPEDGEKNVVLPAGAIDSLAQKNPSIAKIDQPFPSFGGRSRENERPFYQRVSERLRHKNRAIDPWDYSRLLLERYPQLFHVAIVRGGDEECDAMAMVVPRCGVDDARSYRPRSSPTFLYEAETFLAERQSPFCRFRVVNPRYHVVQARFDVVFYDSNGVGRKVEELNRRLRLFLSPWIQADEPRLALGRTLRKSDALRFINSQASVKLVLDFSFVGEDERLEAIPLRYPDGLFVTADSHLINPIVEPES